MCIASESNGQSIATLAVINSNFLEVLRGKGGGASCASSCGCMLLGEGSIQEGEPADNVVPLCRCYFNHLPFGKFVISIGRSNIDRIHVTIDDCSALLHVECHQWWATG